MQKLQSSNASVYLVNTGWHGGSYVSGGKRFDLSVTRKIIDHIHSGAVLAADKAIFPMFDLQVPTALAGIDSDLLDPRKTWSDQASFTKHCGLLHSSCQKNFEQYAVDEVVVFS